MLNHKQKTKLARRLRTGEEASNKVSIFQTKSWYAHKKSLQLKRRKLKKK